MSLFAHTTSGDRYQTGGLDSIAPASLHTLTHPSPEGEVPSRDVGDSPCSCKIAPTSSVDNPASFPLLHTRKTCTLWYHVLSKHVLDI